MQNIQFGKRNDIYSNTQEPEKKERRVSISNKRLVTDGSSQELTSLDVKTLNVCISCEISQAGVGTCVCWWRGANDTRLTKNSILNISNAT